MNSFNLTIRTPEESLYNGHVKSIFFTAEGGDMQLFAHHASLTATIAFSPIKIEEEGTKEELFFVRRGLFLFDNKANTATLLALTGEKRSEISHQTAKEYFEFLEQQLREGHDLSEYQILYLEGEKLAVEQQIKAIKE